MNKLPSLCIKHLTQPPMQGYLPPPAQSCISIVSHWVIGYQSVVMLSIYRKKEPLTLFLAPTNPISLWVRGLFIGMAKHPCRWKTEMTLAILNREFINQCIRVIGFSATEPIFGCSFSLPAQNCIRKARFLRTSSKTVTEIAQTEFINWNCPISPIAPMKYVNRCFRLCQSMF